MKTPDVTPVQIVSLSAAIITMAVQFGAHLNNVQQQSLLAVIGLLASMVIADSHIRNGRAKGK